MHNESQGAVAAGIRAGLPDSGAADPERLWSRLYPSRLWDDPAPYEFAEKGSQAVGYLDRLHPGDHEVLRARLAGWTLRQIGAACGRSPERVRVLEARALRQIRRWLEYGDTQIIRSEYGPYTHR